MSVLYENEGIHKVFRDGWCGVSVDPANASRMFLSKNHIRHEETGVDPWYLPPWAGNIWPKSVDEW